jgi:hypothetical protein
MAKGFQTIIETATIVQNTYTEVLGSTIYGQVPLDVVRVIEEFGLFGDSTTGTYFDMLNDINVLVKQAFPNLTTVTRDNVFTPKHPARPGSTLRLYIFATAASPGKYKVWLKGKDFSLDELG